MAQCRQNFAGGAQACLSRKGQVPGRFIRAIPLLAALAIAPGCENMEPKTRESPKTLASVPIARQGHEAGYKSLLESIRSKGISDTYSKAMEYIASDAPKEYRTQLFDAFFQAYGNEKASGSLFRFLSESKIPKQQKYQVMDHFIAKVGNPALAQITVRAYLDLGLNFTKKTEDLPKETLSYIQCLGHGMSRFGAAGFIAAEKLLEPMDKAFALRIPLFSKRDAPLSELLVYMVTEKLAKEGKLDLRGSMELIAEKYLLKKEGEFDFSSAAGAGINREPGLRKLNIAINVLVILSDAAKPHGKSKDFIENLLANPNLKEDAKTLLTERFKPPRAKRGG